MHGDQTSARCSAGSCCPCPPFCTPCKAGLPQHAPARLQHLVARQQLAPQLLHAGFQLAPLAAPLGLQRSLLFAQLLCTLCQAVTLDGQRRHLGLQLVLPCRRLLCRHLAGLQLSLQGSLGRPEGLRLAAYLLRLRLCQLTPLLQPPLLGRCRVGRPLQAAVVAFGAGHGGSEALQLALHALVVSSQLVLELRQLQQRAEVVDWLGGGGVVGAAEINS